MASLSFSSAVRIVGSSPVILFIPSVFLSRLFLLLILPLDELRSCSLPVSPYFPITDLIPSRFCWDNLQLQVLEIFTWDLLISRPRFLIHTGHGSQCKAVGQGWASQSLESTLKYIFLAPLPTTGHSEYTWDRTTWFVLFKELPRGYWWATRLETLCQTLPLSHHLPLIQLLKKKTSFSPNLCSLSCSQSQLRVSLPTHFSSKPIYPLHDGHNCLLRAQPDYRAQNIHMSFLVLHRVRPTPSLPEPPQLQQGASSPSLTSPTEPTTLHYILPSRPCSSCTVPWHVSPHLPTPPIKSHLPLQTQCKHQPYPWSPLLALAATSLMLSKCCLYTHNRTLSAVPSIPLSKIPISVCPPDRYCLRVGTVLFFSYVPPKSVQDWPWRYC